MACLLSNYYFLVLVEGKWKRMWGRKTTKQLRELKKPLDH